MVDAYAQKSATWFRGEMDAAPDARTALHGVLSAAARMCTQADEPAGCMISTASPSVPPAPENLRCYMADLRRSGEALTAERIRQGITAGDMPPDSDPSALAAFSSTISRPAPDT